MRNSHLVIRTLIVGTMIRTRYISSIYHIHTKRPAKTLMNQDQFIFLLLTSNHLQKCLLLHYLRNVAICMCCYVMIRHFALVKMNENNFVILCNLCNRRFSEKINRIINKNIVHDWRIEKLTLLVLINLFH